MTRTPKIILIGLAVFVLLLGIAAWMVSRVDVKARFELAASRATGLQVNVTGKTSVRLLPTLHVSLSNVTVRNDDREIAFVGDADASVEYLPLLRKEAVLRSVRLRDVKLELERDAQGNLNIKSSHAEGTESDHTIGPVRIEHVSLEVSHFRYNNRKLGKFIDAADCTIDDDDFQLTAGPGADFMKNVLLAARVHCKQMRNNRFTGEDVKLNVAGKEGKLKFSPISLQMLGGKGSAVIDGDYTGEIPSYQVHYDIAQLQVSELFKSIAPTKAGTGRLDFAADLSMQGFNSIELTRTAKGEASLRGKDLDLAIGDLDDKLKRYESTQSFNLVDIGALFIAGPIGPAITKGAEYATLFQNAEGNTHVATFVSQWNVDRGIAHAADVAMTTKESRLAMKGALDFTKKEYDDVVVAALDGAGCVRVQQKVSGPFGKPDIKKPDVLKSLAGPIRRLIEKVKGSKCEVFYPDAAAPRK